MFCNVFQWGTGWYIAVHHQFVWDPIFIQTKVTFWIGHPDNFTRRVEWSAWEVIFHQSELWELRDSRDLSSTSRNHLSFEKGEHQHHPTPIGHTNFRHPFWPHLTCYRLPASRAAWAVRFPFAVVPGGGECE